MMSYDADFFGNRSACLNRMCRAGVVPDAFFRAKERAAREMSVAVIESAVSHARVTAIAPEPVPMSINDEAEGCCSTILSVVSINTSVSGRGMSADERMVNGRPKNSLDSIMYAIGSRLARRHSASKKWRL